MLKNNLLFLEVPSKPSIELWLLLLLISFGFVSFSKTYIFSPLHLLNFGVIISRLFRLLTTRFFKRLNMWRLIFISFVKRSLVEIFCCSIFLLRLNLLIFLRSRSCMIDSISYGPNSCLSMLLFAGGYWLMYVSYLSLS